MTPTRLFSPRWAKSTAQFVTILLKKRYPERKQSISRDSALGFAPFRMTMRSTAAEKKAVTVVSIG